MKILAINGSPRGRNSNTDRILLPFLEGTGEAGAETEVVYLNDKKINYCTGCFTCWTKTPGVCIHNDDMPSLLEKIRHAHIVVYTTPLYVFTVSGLMKNFMDRMLPLVDPHIIKRGDQYIHPSRYPDDNINQLKKDVLISNCGYPERHHFSGLVETFRVFNSSRKRDLAATILCTAGELLKVPEAQESVQWYIDAIRRAGQEFVEEGRITPGTQELLDRNLMDAELYSQMANGYWDSLIVKQPKLEKVTEESDLATLSLALHLSQIGSRMPETFQEVITGQAVAFNPQTAGSLRADIQFIISEGEPEDYVLQIAEGKCTAYQGTIPSPTLTIHTPSEVWLQIARKELNGQTAYMKGLYRIEGDFGLLLRMDELFSKKGDR
jgi:hypothetical protein